VVTSGATVVLIIGATVVPGVDVTVVLVATKREIALVDVLAG
jgi:hypothetical protein